MKAEVIVTTTDSIIGCEIQQIIGPINNFLIKGTNIFSDLFASISDVVGGYSQSYQRQIQKLYDNVLDGLKEKAKINGANCILNLKIDFEEISGQNKQMFMLTANGTAAIVKYIISNSKNEYYITNDDLENEISKHNFINRIRNENKYNSATLTEALDYNDNKLLLEIIKIISLFDISFYAFSENEIPDNLLIKIFKENNGDSFFKKEIIEIFYKSNIVFMKRYWKILKESNVIDYESLYNIFKETDKEKLRYLIQLLDTSKYCYSKQDVEALKILVEYIDQIDYPIEIIKKKKTFSNTEIELWHCDCNIDNQILTETCSNCGKDKYGFASGLDNHKTILAKLKIKISKLELLFELRKKT